MNCFWRKVFSHHFFILLLPLVLVTTSRDVIAAQITITWSDKSTNEDGFRIERRTDTTVYAQISQVGANNTTFIDSTVAAGTTYCYRVRAYNTAGNSSYSNEDCGTVPIVPYSLTVVKSGSGTVSSLPAGISCGSDCSQTYTNVTSVTLTATPASGYLFNGWSDDCSGTGPCTLLINANTNVTANFDTIAPPTTPTPAGLVAAYSFSEGSGTTVKDSSGFNNTGTLSGAAWTSSGKFGTALSFNGTNAWVTIPDALSLDLTTGMTLEAWVYPTALNGGTTNGWRTVILKEAGNTASYDLYANQDTNKPGSYLSIGGTDHGVDGPSQLPLNTWTHLAATYDGAQVRLFINGTQIGQQAQSGSALISSGALRIGGNSVWGEYFQGMIDNVRIYNRALTATELQANMNTPVGTTPPSTLGLSSVGSAVDSGDSNYLNGSKVTVGGTSVSVSAISVFVGAVDTAPNNQYQVAIYTNQNGAPGTLVASSTSGTLTPNAWNTRPLVAQLQANTSYWLMYNTNGRTGAVNNMYYNVGSAGQGAYSTNGVSFGSWPTTFGAATLTNGVFSLYATTVTP